MQEAQREQFATLTLNTAVELTAAALGAAAGLRLAPTSRRSRFATRCACSSPRRWRSSAPPARASCASSPVARSHLESPRVEAFDRRSSGMLPAVPRPRRAAALGALHRRARRSATPARRRRPQRRGKLATIDVLGEEITRAGRGGGDRRRYLDVLAAIERDGLDANISREADGARAGARPRRSAARTSTRSSPTRPRAATSCGSTWRTRLRPTTTLALYRELRESGRDNVGVVLQACAAAHGRRRAALADLRPSVRLCKGIYVEPATIAFQDFDAVRASFVARARGAARGWVLRRRSRPTTSG